MAIRWKIPFAPLRSQTTYTVNVEDEGYTGEAVELTGAAHPMETQEDDDADMFKPVRTQSGYLRIVDSGKDNSGNAFDWTEMMPATGTSRKVTLTDGNGTIRWRGYMQAQTFGSRMYEDVEEREFPLCCALSVLEGVMVDASVRGIKPIAYLLQQILSATGYQWRYLYFGVTDRMLVDWMLKQIDWANFLEEDQGQELVAKYTYAELLEELCKFLGWTCRTWGTDIYFLSPNETYGQDMVRIDEQDLDMLARGEVPQVVSFDYDMVDMDRDIYASNQQKLEMLRGTKKVTLTADINKQEVIVDLPYSKIEDMYKERTPQDQIYGTNGHYFVLNYPDFLYAASYTFDDLLIEASGISGSINRGASFRVQEWFEGNLNYKHNYNWSTVLYVQGDTGSTVLFKMQSRIPHNYDHGVFTINAGVAQVFIASGSRQEYIANGKLICKLAIGTKWWDGTAWVSTETTFELPIGREGETDGSGQGQIIDNRVLNGPYNAYTGHGIPIGAAMGGIVTFEIYGVQLDNPHQQVPAVEITNLEMKFVRMKAYSAYNDREENQYSVENASVFRGEVSVDTIFATNNGNALGLGIIMNMDGSYCDGLLYEYASGGGNERPEEHLVDRMGNYYSEVRKSATLEVRTDEVSISPGTRVNLGWGNATGYPVAISHDWRDDVTTLKIMEI